MRKVLIGSAALGLVAGGFLAPRALATPNTSSSAQCGDVTLNISRTVLWPPNHKMIPITVTASDTDGDGDSTNVMLGMITNSDETGSGAAEVNGTGQPDVAAGDQSGSPSQATVNDPGSATFNISLAAERSGHDNGSGRTYSIPFRCTDESMGVVPGESGTATLTVFVPHDQGK